MNVCPGFVYLSERKDDPNHLKNTAENFKNYSQVRKKHLDKLGKLKIALFSRCEEALRSAPNRESLESEYGTLLLDTRADEVLRQICYAVEYMEYVGIKYDTMRLADSLDR